MEIRERMKVAKSDIAGKGDLTQFFKRYSRQHGCYLHNTSDHTIFDCNEVKNICKVCDREESYKLFRTERKNKYSQKSSEIKEIQAKAKRGAKAKTLSHKKQANSAMAIELKAFKVILAKSQLEHKQLKAKKKKKKSTTTTRKSRPPP